MPSHVRRIVVSSVATGMFLLSASWIAAANDTRQSAEFPVLRTFMLDMGNHMQVIADAISREDWTLVATTAPRLAERPKPSMAERVRLLAFLGTSAGEFRSYDKESRHAARALELAAMHGDGKASIAAFATLEASCLRCHRDFQKSFVEEFKDEP